MTRPSPAGHLETLMWIADELAKYGYSSTGEPRAGARCEQARRELEAIQWAIALAKDERREMEKFNERRH